MIEPPKKRNPAVPPSTNGVNDFSLSSIETIPPGGETVQEFAYRQSVTCRSVWRWLQSGLLVTTKTPSGRVRIMGVREP